MSAQIKGRADCSRKAAQENTNANRDSTSPRRKKWERILLAFLSGNGWHALAAVRELGTTCLHSDIAGLEARGLKFHRQRITVPGHGGAKTAVTCYTLRPDSFALARVLLGMATHSGPSVGDAEREYRRASGG